MSNASTTNSITGDSESKSHSGNKHLDCNNTIIPNNHNAAHFKTDNGAVVTADGNSDSALPTSSTTKSSKNSALSEEPYSESYC